MAKRKNPNRSKKKKNPGNKGGSRSVSALPKSPTGKPVHVGSRALFEKYLQDDYPVLVDFWAPWCGPCKMMGPIFEKVSKDFEGKVHFLKVNTQETPDISGGFGIRSIPTILALVGTEVVDSHVGVVGDRGLEKMAQRAHDKAEGVTFGAKIKRLFSKNKSSSSPEPTP